MIQYDGFSISTYGNKLEYWLCTNSVPDDNWLSDGMNGFPYTIDSRHTANGYNTILNTARNEER